MMDKIKSYNNEINNRKLSKEKELVDAVKNFLKTECYELYEKNNLKEAFKQAESDETVRLEILNIIDGFLFEDRNQRNMF